MNKKLCKCSGSWARSFLIKSALPFAISIPMYSLTKQKAPQVNLRRFLLPFVKIWVSKLKKKGFYIIYD